ncbi:MAG: hypothetical protein ABR941_05740 [Thermoleophilia bacterium]|jgi:hypothetical protein
MSAKEIPYEEGTPPEPDWSRGLAKLKVKSVQVGARATRSLEGDCPRCGHPIAKNLDVGGPMLGYAKARLDEEVVFLSCNCHSGHAGAPAGAVGCGAEGGVRLSIPPSPVDIPLEQRQADRWVEKAYNRRLAGVRKLAQQWQTTLGVLTGLLGASTVIGAGTGFHELPHWGRVAYGIVAAAALSLAAIAVYLAAKAGTAQIVDEVPAGAGARLALEDKLYADSKTWLGWSKWLSLFALIGLAGAIGILWYA